jgi:hypothetical protein
VVHRIFSEIIILYSVPDGYFVVVRQYFLRVHEYLREKRLILGRIFMDCSFTANKGWFRYRAAAIIIEDDCVLMAKNDRDDMNRELSKVAEKSRQ